ncbi:hypothetical protein D3C74_213620 [compost metagenome]
MFDAENVAADEWRGWDERIRATAEVMYRLKNPNTRKKRLSLSDRVYLAKYIEFDGPTMMGSLLGRHRTHIATLVVNMKKNGDYERYKNLSDEEYEKILEAEERRNEHAL